MHAPSLCTAVVAVALQYRSYMQYMSRFASFLGHYSGRPHRLYTWRGVPVRVTILLQKWCPCRGLGWSSMALHPRYTCTYAEHIKLHNNISARILSAFEMSNAAPQPSRVNYFRESNAVRIVDKCTSYFGFWEHQQQQRSEVDLISRKFYSGVGWLLFLARVLMAQTGLSVVALSVRVCFHLLRNVSVARWYDRKPCCRCCCCCSFLSWYYR